MSKNDDVGAWEPDWDKVRHKWSGGWGGNAVTLVQLQEYHRQLTAGPLAELKRTQKRLLEAIKLNSDMLDILAQGR